MNPGAKPGAGGVGKGNGVLPGGNGSRGIYGCIMTLAAASGTCRVYDYVYASACPFPIFFLDGASPIPNIQRAAELGYDARPN